MGKRELRVLSVRTIEDMEWFDNGDYHQSFLHYDEVVQDTCCIRIRSATKWGALDVTGTLVLDIDYDELKPVGDKYLARQGFRRCFYNVKGELLFAETLGNYTVEHFLGEKVAIVRQICKDWRFALFDVEHNQLLSSWGNVCIALDFCFLLKKDNFCLDQKCIFVNSKGEFGDARYSQKDKYQVLSVQGRCLVFKKKKLILRLPCNDLQLLDFNVPGKMWFVACKNGKKALFDAAGQKVLDFLYDEISRIGWRAGRELFFVRNADGVGIVSREDEQILPLQYKIILLLKEGFLLISKEEKEGYAGNDGKVVLPAKYPRVEVDFFSRMIKVFENEKCWICDFDGKRLLPDEYDEADIYLCKEGIIFKQGDFISRTGDVVLSGFTKIERLSNFGYAVLLVCRGKKYGLFDFHGNEVIPVEYDLIEANAFGYRGVNLF